MPSHNSIEFTVRRRLQGPVIYVRVAKPIDGPGTWIWGPWKPADLSQCDRALMKILELNIP